MPHSATIQAVSPTSFVGFQQTLLRAHERRSESLSLCIFPAVRSRACNRICWKSGAQRRPTASGFSGDRRAVAQDRRVSRGLNAGPGVGEGQGRCSLTGLAAPLMHPELSRAGGRMGEALWRFWRLCWRAPQKVWQVRGGDRGPSFFLQAPPPLK